MRAADLRRSRVGSGRVGPPTPNDQHESAGQRVSWRRPTGPNAASVELFGECNEDWLRILRIRQVRSSAGDVLFDIAEGHDDPRVEAAVDEANYEHLDLLLDLTGDLHMGRSSIP